MKKATIYKFPEPEEAVRLGEEISQRRDIKEYVRRFQYEINDILIRGGYLTTNLARIKKSLTLAEEIEFFMQATFRDILARIRKDHILSPFELQEYLPDDNLIKDFFEDKDHDIIVFLRNELSPYLKYILSTKDKFYNEDEV